MKRAVVTVLKADISGSTPLGERLDPEELRGVLGVYFAALARGIEAHGGRVDKYIGDAVMAVFGAPQALPDHALAACQAALAARAALETVNARYAAHSADHRGALGVVHDDFTRAQMGNEEPV